MSKDTTTGPRGHGAWRLASARGPRGALAGLLPCLAALACLVSCTSSSAASRYVLEKCDSELPGGGVEGAVFHGTAPFNGAQNCAEAGGSIFVVQQGDSGTGSGYWTLPLPPPPGGYVETVTVTGSMCNGANQDAGTVAYAVSAGWALDCVTQTHTFAVNSSSGSPGVVYLGCEGSCAGDPEAWAGAFAATEVDPVAPKIEAIEDTSLAAGPARGHQTIAALAEDEGGGVAAVGLRVNGQPTPYEQSMECATTRVQNPSYSGVVAIRPTPCPPKVEARWTVDTSQPPFVEGANTVTACAVDFSTIGQPNEGCATESLTVDNSCAESATATGASLNARFLKMKGRTKAVHYGRGAKIRGRLLDAAGAPVPGATVCVAVATEGRGYEPQATTTTDAEGWFAYAAPPGPDRVLRFAYRHDSTQIERSLLLATHTQPTLRARPRRLVNGERVALRGRLPGPGAAGRVVVLQAAVPGAHRWITFRKATTGGHGRFKARYRFTSTTRKISYGFRALVPRQTGYPWLQGASRSVRVAVAP